MTRWTAGLVVAALTAAPASADPPAKLSDEQSYFFETRIRPVLAEKCYSCHGEKKQSAGLRLDTAAGVRKGADDGPVVVPGDPGKSRLVKSVKRDGDYAMPPKDALPAQQVADLAEWVRQGAPHPADAATAKSTPDPAKHWAFQPVKLPPLPETKTPTANPIDRFILDRLEAKNLTLSPPADRRTLLRRAAYDLTGLPPTAEEVAAFEADAAPDAFEKVVDRLLASPHYGERWGRYWLDVARYADTKGYVFTEDRNFPFAYTYRDYVIRSFNEDKPFDRFVVEQLAADRLALGADKSALAAMGYLTLGRRFLNNTPDIIDDRIDVVTRGMMGLTVACARCHDHKYDPIPAKDYYSLYGVFASSAEPKELPLIAEPQRTPEVVAFEQEVARKQADLQAEKAKRHAAALGKLRTPEAVGDYVRTVLDSRGKTPEQTQTLVRERDLNAFVFGRWRPHVTDQVTAGNVVFAPLAALHAVSDADFATKAAGVLDGLPNDKSHPAVRAGLRAAKPKTFRDAAVAFGKVVAEGQGDAALAAVLAPLDIPVTDADRVLNRLDNDQLGAIKKKIDAFQASNPHAPPRAHVLNDGGVQEPVVFLRGNPGNRGPAVPRQMVAVAAPAGRQPFKEGSGRLELARAVASPDNPLTARVFVNRVWAGHFGAGLVRTPSDFGLRSDPPTHPELLDWLAHRFVVDGWSVKKLHKLVMLSAAYRQGSGTPDALVRADPENKLVGRQTRRRLDFEALRDSLLAAAGTLDRTPGGRPVDLFKAPFTTRRTVYGAIDRSNLPGTFRVFDFASPDQHSPQRFLTTVPQQALFLMNSPFVQEQAKALAARPEMASAADPAAKVAALYRLALGRGPTPAEAALGAAFVADAAAGRWEQFAQVLLLSNEFAFVD